jgi:hypothetical protein
MNNYYPTRINNTNIAKLREYPTPTSLAEWDAFHDVIADLMTVKKIDDKTLLLPESLLTIFNQLPEGVKATSIEWGMGDTVFRDLAYEWLAENWPKAKVSNNREGI